MASLHPTPAVCGFPTEEARLLIAQSGIYYSSLFPRYILFQTIFSRKFAPQGCFELLVPPVVVDGFPILNIQLRSMTCDLASYLSDPFSDYL